MEDLFDKGFENFRTKKNVVCGRTPKTNAIFHHYRDKNNQYHIQFSQETSREMVEKGLTNVNVIRNRYTGELTLVFNADGEGAKFSAKKQSDITNSAVVRYIMKHIGLDPDAEIHKQVRIGDDKALNGSYMAFTIDKQQSHEQL